MEEREENNDDKTEEPTDERRRQFREEGKLASTREIVGAFSLIIMTLIAYFYGSQLVSSIGQLFSSTWRIIGFAAKEQRNLQVDIFNAIAPLLIPLSVLSLVVVTAPTLVGLLLSRFNWTWKKLEFDLNKINPITGLGNIYGKNIFFETTKSILKATVLSVVGYLIIRKELDQVLGYMHSDPVLSLGMAGSAIIKLLVAACIATLFIGAIDFSWNLFTIERELKMTKDQVKKEIKYQEGDPLFKSARRRFARDVLLKSSIDKVPQATFVVTNPTHFSVAIRYSAELPAPIVVSKGQDYMALRIRQIAKANDIMIVENKVLARALYKTVEIGDEIPSTLYVAVIEILKSVYRARGKNYFERFGIARQFA